MNKQILSEPELQAIDFDQRLYENNYYHYLRSDEFKRCFLDPIAQQLRTRGIESVLDIGCGEGQLAGSLGNEVRYFGLDASPKAIESARQRYANWETNFIVARFEEFIEWDHVTTYEALVFGNILEVLVKEECRLPLIKSYIRVFKPRYIVVYDLTRLETSSWPKPEWEHYASANLELDPDCKRHRKILIYNARSFQ